MYLSYGYDFKRAFNHVFVLFGLVWFGLILNSKLSLRTLSAFKFPAMSSPRSRLRANLEGE